MQRIALTLLAHDYPSAVVDKREYTANPPPPSPSYSSIAPTGVALSGSMNEDVNTHIVAVCVCVCASVCGRSRAVFWGSSKSANARDPPSAPTLHTQRFASTLFVRRFIPKITHYICIRLCMCTFACIFAIDLNMKRALFVDVWMCSKTITLCTREMVRHIGAYRVAAHVYESLLVLPSTSS